MRRFFFGVAMALALVGHQALRADDQQIAQQIVQALKQQQAAGNLRGFKIDLVVEDGTVVLKGRVANAEQQRLALDIARRTAGVQQVVNGLEIQPTGGDQPVLGKLQEAIHGINPFHSLRRSGGEALADRSSEKPMRSVLSRPAPKMPATTASREAQTSNVAAAQPVHVDPPAETSAAGQAAPPAGPTAVNRPSDEQIAREIYERLQQYKQAGHLHGFRLDMQVQQGTVILEGQVPVAEQKQLALEVARRVPGVYQVVDMIRVEPPEAVMQTVSTGEASARRRPMPTTAARTAPTSVTQAEAATAPQPPAPASVPAPAGEPARVPPADSVVGTHGSPAMLQPITAVPLQMVPNTVGIVIQPQPLYYNYQPMPSSPTMAQPVPQLGLPPAAPIQAYYGSATSGVAQVRYDHPQLPNYAWPTYAAYPNYAAVTYPKQYSPAAWPYIGPFYPYPQVPLGWRKVTLQWDDGWWYLDFKSK